MEELNRRGKKFVNEWCDEVHGTTKRIPNQHYLIEEKAVLLPLPKTRYRTKRLQKRKLTDQPSVTQEKAFPYQSPLSVRSLGVNVQ